MRLRNDKDEAPASRESGDPAKSRATSKRTFCASSFSLEIWSIRPETKTRIPNLPEMDPIAKAVSPSSTVTLNRGPTFRGFHRLCPVEASAQQEVFPGCVTDGSSSN